MDMDGIRNACTAWFASVRVTDYERNSADGAQLEHEKATRIKVYVPLFASALGIMYWRGTIMALTQMSKIRADVSYICSLGFTICLLLILLGGIAARLPARAPWSQGVAGLGAWQSLLFILGTFHVDTFQFHPEALYSFCSMLICATLVTIYWGYSAQDPLIVHLLSKLIVWVILLICRFVVLILSCLLWIFCFIGEKAGTWSGMDRLLDVPSIALTVQLACHNWFANISIKDYERDKNDAEKEQEKTTRLDAYLALYVSALAIMYWGSTTKALAEMQKTMPVVSYICALCFTFGLLLILLGTIAASLPSSAPWSQCVAGVGAWQALLFILGTFHVDTFRFHPESKYCLCSMVICSVLITVYLGFSGQDPLILHIFAKMIIWVVLRVFQIVTFILSFLLWIIGECSCGIWAVVQEALGRLEDMWVAYNNAQAARFNYYPLAREPQNQEET
ncbi:hypothetical protein ACP4OV_015060 [Aristida adscensionis]